jgi:hypothetical protein
MDVQGLNLTGNKYGKILSFLPCTWFAQEPLNGRPPNSK